MLSCKLLLLLFALVSKGTCKTALRKRNLLDTFECILTEVATETPDHDTLYEHMCIGKGLDGEFDIAYHIDDDNNSVNSAIERLDIMHNSGRYKITMTNIVKEVAPVITTTPDTDVEIDDLGVIASRRELAIQGTRDMIIFRVTAPDATVSKTAADIADAFFGTNGDQNNLSSRYEACSFNKLKFIPGTGTDVTNGVAEISIDMKIAGSENIAIQDAVTQAIIKKYGSSLREEYDHLVYALPYGTTFGTSGSTRWLAYAYMNSYLSVYNGENIMYVSYQVHETGHNLGLMHSNHDSPSYGDQSGAMGFGYSKNDSPRLCFNAAKSWALGWYEDRSMEVTEDLVKKGWQGNIDSFVDYDEVAENEYVLVKVSTKYLIYNKKKSINDETMEFANTVSISDAQDMGSFSDAVAALGSAGQMYEFDGITVELCSMQNDAGIDQATLGIYQTGSQSSCTDTRAGQDEHSGTDAPIPANSFQCILIEIATEFEETDTEYENACLAKGEDGGWDVRYNIDDNHGMIINEISEQGLDVLHHSGRYKVTMTNVDLNDEYVVTTTTNTEIEIDDLGEGASSSRRLGQVTGTRTMVIIRVSTSDGRSSSKSASKIADAFFGIAGDQTSLKVRYEECSMGKLNFVPGTGRDFVDGVSELTVAVDASSNTIQSLERSITTAVVAKYGSSLRNSYDHVVYAVPRGTSYGVGGSTRWLAYAYMNSYLSVYNDDNIVYISNQVHETGHNLGLMHSNHGEVRYGDQSGTMGFGYGKEDFPKMCFNAAKSWQLGWYDDRSIEVKPQDGSFTGKLSAFVDYRITDGYVLMKVGTKYVIYNRAKGTNSQTMEFANQVTISDMPFEGDFSDAVGALGGNGAKYTFSHSGGTAVIEYCSSDSEEGVDSVKIGVYMESAGTSCNAPMGRRPTPPVPPNPTNSPIPESTPRPVVPPTRAPIPPPPMSSPTLMPVTKQCSNGLMDVQITIHTDSKPQETSWVFKRRRGETYGSGSGFAAFRTYTYQYCVKATDTFEFHLMDSGGDGIQSSEYGHGYYTIQVNGNIYSSGGNFKSEEVDYVQGPCTKANTKRLQVILETGFRPEDVTWSITSDPGDVINYVGGPWPQFSGQSFTYFAHTCLDDSVCYTVGVQSANGNGLDRGSFEVNWDFSNVGFTTFKDGDSEYFSLGQCEQRTSGRELDLRQEVEVFDDFEQ